MIGTGSPSVDLITKEDLLKVVHEDYIFMHYFNITSIPCLINSPLRKDDHPSFSIFSFNGKIYWKDYATNQHGNIFDLLMSLWCCNFQTCINRIYKELNCDIEKINISKTKTSTICKSQSTLDVKIRDWNNGDISYWSQYGIGIKTLKWAEIYPISHIIISRGNTKNTIVADKLAYVYIERKEGIVTKKVYQPYNKGKLKWISKHDHSVVSLWRRMINLNKYYNRICICSSVKDALCLFENLHIPSIALQGEGYGISDTAQNVLKEKFEHIYILFDNDDAGIKYGRKLSEKTGFTYLELPYFDDGKDISDLYKCVNDKELFKTIIEELFK